MIYNPCPLVAFRTRNIEQQKKTADGSFSGQTGEFYNRIHESEGTRTLIGNIEHPCVYFYIYFYPTFISNLCTWPQSLWVVWKEVTKYAKSFHWEIKGYFFNETFAYIFKSFSLKEVFLHETPYWRRCAGYLNLQWCL